jgi:SAM-dependent methyltransferase
MGAQNQYLWIEKHQSLIKGPILEIGSKYYSDDTFINYRKLCEGLEYIGVDLSQGRNVDLTIDFRDDFHQISHKLGYRKFNTIICCSVLEHVDEIFKFCKNISQFLDKGGILFISVPFTWEFHGYPDDYWRFSPKAIEFLFPDFRFDYNLRAIASQIDGDIIPFENNPNDFILRRHIIDDFIHSKFKIISFMSLIKNLLTRKRFFLEWLIKLLQGKSYRFIPSLINMVGIKIK